MMNLHTVKDALRNKYAWPGGYAHVLWMHDGEAMCTDCGRENFKEIARAGIARTACKSHDSDWLVLDTSPHWEGEPLQCVHSSKSITSEYGEV